MKTKPTIEDIMVDLHKEYQETLKVLDEVLADAVKNLGYEDDDYEATGFIIDFLKKEKKTSVKKLVRDIAKYKKIQTEMSKFG